MSRLLRATQRLRNPSDLWLFLQILLTLIFLPTLIRRFSLPDLLKRLDPGVLPHRQSKARLEKTVGFVDTLIRYRAFQRYGECLLRSLILFRFLRRQGWPVEIHFGVRKVSENSPQITGHSWLVLERQPFLEKESQQDTFSTTYVYRGENA